MYYHTCPICGANLDPGERCNCYLEYDELLKSDETREFGLHKLHKLLAENSVNY